MRLFKRMPQTTRVLIGGLAALCIVTGLTVIMSTRLLQESAESEGLARVDSNMKVASRLLHGLGSVQLAADGEMVAGAHVLNEDASFVDDVQGLVGGVASVFQGDIRIATNVLQANGRRGTGTRLVSIQVRQALLLEGHSFRGIVDVLGKRYFSAYDPILDESGREIGILYVGVEETEALRGITQVRNLILAISFAAIVVVGAILAWIGSKVARQIALRQGLLETAHSQLDTALSNMASGLCLWNGAHKLVLGSGRVATVLGLAEGFIQPGMSFRHFLHGLHEAGHFGELSFEKLYHTRVTIVARRRPLASVETGPNGRTITMQVRPVEGGGWVTTYEDVTEQHRAEARVAFMAKHDGLTGLANRTFFRERLLSLHETCHPFALLTFDLDRFKRVNDTLGHSVGDSLLKTVAGRLQASIREGDLVARLGGDEFAVIQCGATDHEAAKSLAIRIVESLSRPYEVEGHTLQVGASGGIATSGANGSSIETLLKQADTALYVAKAAGSGACRFFDASMETMLRQRQMLEADLRQALANGELQVFYQPLVDTSSGEISCFEALLRWFHPVRGAVSPGEFIPVAEELGLINEIGTWVLRRACHDAARWPGDIKVAVNLSALQFEAGGLPETVEAALREAGLDAARLELEITESVLLQDIEAVNKVLHALHRLGARVAMDDFGTGYSSLAYLRSFPFDKIKIDQTFIREIDQAETGAIVRAVVALAASLGMQTVAEGVETQKQYDRVLSEGCGEVQGYLFSKPRPANQVADMLAEVDRHFRRRATAGGLPAVALVAARV